MIIAKDITVKHNELCQISQCCLYRACLCKLLSTVGPTLCTYLYSQATFRHVTVVATTSSREHNTTNQTNTATGRCLSCHTHIAISQSPFNTELFMSCLPLRVMCTWQDGRLLIVLFFVLWCCLP
jgi:hypothetical protein